MVHAESIYDIAMNSALLTNLETEILEKLIELNEQRRNGTRQETLEAFFAEKFEVDCKLAVYGTLAPGRPNHFHLSPLGGQWTDGLSVEGDTVQVGWGTQMGFPAFRWRPGGDIIDVYLLKAEPLIGKWKWIDTFEGKEYVRVLVPLYKDGKLADIANIYEAL